MRNLSVKKILSVAGTEYIKWAVNPRLIIVAVMLVFIKTCAVDPLLECAADMQSPLNVLEPFIAIGNSGFLVLILPLVYLTLMSDFPRMDGNTVFYILRIGRHNWLFGQIIFALMSLASFLLVVFAGSVIPVLTNAYWGNNWSTAVTHYVSQFPDRSAGLVAELITPNLYHQVSVFQGAVQTYLLLACYLFVLALLMLLFNVIKHKKTGFLTVGAVIAFGVASCGTKAASMWLFPMAHSIIWLHYREYLRETIFPMWGTCIYFAGLLILLILLSCLLARRMTFETLSEVD